MKKGVDSFKLLKEINKQAFKHNRVINCLLQFHIAVETTKFGLSYKEAIEILDNELFHELKNICLCGIMGMATLTNDKEQVLNEFDSLHNIFSRLEKHSSTTASFKTISMGMSNDYDLAIQKGSNMVRIGSKIFGERGYAEASKKTYLCLRDPRAQGGGGSPQLHSFLGRGAGARTSRRGLGSG